MDLLGATGLALAAVATVWLGAPVAFTTVLGAPLVLVAPGYVWADVFFGSTLGAEMRAALSVALSFTVTAVGGVLLYAGGVRLDRPSWLALLAGTTIVGAALAATLRARVSLVPPVRSGQQRSVLRMSVTQGLRLGLAALLGVAALGVALFSAHAQVQPAFTQLSFDRHGSAPDTAEVVVVNREHGPEHYRLVVSTDGVVSNVLTFTLADGVSWQRSVPSSPGHRLAADLYRTDTGGPRYRHVTMIVPAVRAK